MHISYAAALATPLKVVIRQLKYDSIEKHMKAQKMKEENAKSNR